MADYGFRISQNEEDVKTCSDLKTVVNSKYSNLKGSISGVVSKTKTGDYQQHTLVAHNLEYIPIVQVYMEGRYGSGVFEQLPITYVVGSSVDSTNVYIYFNNGIDDGTYNFKYFIFLDKGKL